MNESELPSDSDSSDDDYHPSGEESVAASEEESGPDDVEEQDDNDELKPKTNKKGKQKNKSKNTVKRKNVKRKLSDDEDEGKNKEEEVTDIKSVEEQKKKSDSLWADFLKDCDGPPKKKFSSDSSISSSSGNNSSKRNENISDTKANGINGQIESKTEGKENKQTVTQIFEFAGEKVRIDQQVPIESGSNNSLNKDTNRSSIRGRGSVSGSRGGRGGTSLTSFLGQLGKKGKLSTLEKSKLDWDQFKRSEGIEEDLQTHNKGKDGYLEKQDFLQRTDVRRFEIEKALRQKRSGR